MLHKIHLTGGIAILGIFINVSSDDLYHKIMQKLNIFLAFIVLEQRR